MTPANFIDRTGQVFNRLTVVSRAANNGYIVRWNCICICGNTCIVYGNNLQMNHTQSCGCLQTERRGKSSITHGMRNTVEYKSWCHMRSRCFTKTDHKYSSYGAVGITVCKRWLKFENFFADIGYKPSKKHTIDRIDNTGNYTPDNCRWATPTEQVNNRQITRFMTYQGKTLPLGEWTRLYKLPRNLIYSRFVIRGLSPHDTLTMPVK